MDKITAEALLCAFNRLVDSNKVKDRKALDQAYYIIYSDYPDTRSVMNNLEWLKGTEYGLNNLRKILIAELQDEIEVGHR